MTSNWKSDPLRQAARVARDLWIYFKSGHSGYFAFILSMLNFVVLQYNLFVERIPILKQYMPRMSTFFILFSLIYFPVAILIGRFEFKKGTTMRRPFLAPYTQDNIESNIRLRRSLMHYYNGEKENAMKELAESEKLLIKWKYES
jgi:hypothetical protein